MCSFPVVNKIAHVEDLSASQALCWPFKPPPLPSTFSEDVTAVTPRLLQGWVFVRSGNAPSCGSRLVGRGAGPPGPPEATQLP